MYLALGMESVADACSAVGLDRDGSDWEGVKYHIKAFKKKGLDKAHDEVCKRTMVSAGLISGTIQCQETHTK